MDWDLHLLQATHLPLQQLKYVQKLKAQHLLQDSEGKFGSRLVEAELGIIASMNGPLVQSWDLLRPAAQPTQRPRIGSLQ